MSRPIPLEIIPSHVHLSEADQEVLFGAAFPVTVAEQLSQTGQYAYADAVEVRGQRKRRIALRVLGPCRKTTQVELTPTEAQLLGIAAPDAKSGDHTDAGDCVLVGPEGTVSAKASVIIPRPHLHCSDTEAAQLHVHNGKVVTIDLDLERSCTLTDVVVRVHPTYRLHLHIHPDIARTHWLTGVVHGRVREAGL